MKQLAAWQNQRWLWLLGGFMALGLELVAVYYFQGHLKQDPCEKCVYIRFALVAAFMFAMIAAIHPRALICKVVGYVGVLWALVKGWLYSYQLERIILDRLSPDYNPFTSSCSLTNADFPFGLPMNRWVPSHFQQFGICGEDTWQLMGMNMAEWMLMIFTAFIVVVSLMLLSALYERWRKRV